MDHCTSETGLPVSSTAESPALPPTTNTVVLGVMNSPGAMLDCAAAAILLVARNRKAARDVTEEILCEEDESIAIIMPRILSIRPGQESALIQTEEQICRRPDYGSTGMPNWLASITPFCE
jgi:hypothetical protein